MDKMRLCGSCDVGSIPAGSTEEAENRGTNAELPERARAPIGARALFDFAFFVFVAGKLTAVSYKLPATCYLLRVL